MIVQVYRHQQVTPTYSLSAVKSANYHVSSKSFVLRINSPYATLSRTDHGGASEFQDVGGAVNAREPSSVNNAHELLPADIPSSSHSIRGSYHDRYPDEYAPNGPVAHEGNFTPFIDYNKPEIYALGPDPHRPSPRYWIDGLGPLAKRRISGTEIDSSSREPIPRCHPRTRRGLRKRIINWATTSSLPTTAPADIPSFENALRAFWISGPAGIGKTAVAQSVAEELKNMGYLGAAFFFSKDSALSRVLLDDPTMLVASIVYQLALVLPQYGRMVGDVVAKDPGILEQSLAMQFKEFLVEPFVTIMIDGGTSREPRPVTIILDGLDECPDQILQCELVKLVGQSLQAHSYPLKWLISSRSEWYLEPTFYRLDPTVECIHEDLHSLGRRDIEIYMREGLQNLTTSRSPIDDILEWDMSPSPEDTHQLIKLTGHSFTVAVSIMNHLKELPASMAYARIQELIDLTDNVPPLKSLAADTSHPFTTMNELYSTALSRLPHPTVLLILQIFRLWCTQPTLTAPELSNLLSLDRETFYSTLRHLHGLVRFSHDKHNRQYLRHIHPSFLCFISDPNVTDIIYRTGTECMSGSHSTLSCSTGSSNADVLTTIAKSLLHHLQKPRLVTAMKGLSWKSQPPQGFDRTSLGAQDLAVSHRIVTLSVQAAWKFCTQSSGSESADSDSDRDYASTIDNVKMSGSLILKPPSMKQKDSFWYDFFVRFDFGKLSRDVGGCGRIPVKEFRRFVMWLYQLVHRRHRALARSHHPIVRTKAQYPVDQALVETCEEIAEPMDLDSPEGDDEYEGQEETVQYVLLGVNTKTGIVLFTREEVTIYSMDDLDEL